MNNAMAHYIASRHTLDFPPECAAIVTPAMGGVAPERASTGDPSWQAPWSYVGAPTVSIPIPSPGLPLAAQVIGRHLGDRSLLWTAWQLLEANTSRPIRLPPVLR